MKTFETMPYGYRWLCADEVEQFNSTPENRRCGWMNYLAICTNTFNVWEYIRPWDCMIEFGMDHDHDAVVCERIMADMNPDYGVSEHYNNGVKEYY